MTENTLSVRFVHRVSMKKSDYSWSRIVLQALVTKGNPFNIFNKYPYMSPMGRPRLVGSGVENVCSSFSCALCNLPDVDVALVGSFASNDEWDKLKAGGRRCAKTGCRYGSQGESNAVFSPKHQVFYRLIHLVRLLRTHRSKASHSHPRHGNKPRKDLGRDCGGR